MTARTAAWISGTVVVVCVVGYLVMLALFAITDDWRSEYFLAPLLMTYPVGGALIVSRQPHNSIGWLFVIAGGLSTLGLLGAASVASTLGADPEYWQRVAGWLANIILIVGFYGLVLALAFLFPTGRTLSPRWSMAAIMVATIMLSTFAYTAIRPGSLLGYYAHAHHLTNPFGISGAETIGALGGVLALPLAAIVILTSLASILTRVRRSRGVERLQVKWFAAALGVVGVMILTSGVGPGVLPDGWAWIGTLAGDIFFISAALTIPVTIGIAIQRYGLYDMGRLVNRGLVYLMLTVSLLLVYLGLILLLGTLLRSFSGQTSGLVTATSTLVCAALFRPFRSRIQSGVNRRFYRRAYNATRMIEAFSTQLQTNVEIDGVSRNLQRVVVETMQPAHVSLWLRPTKEPRT